MKKSVFVAFIVLVSTVGLVLSSFGAEKPQYGRIMKCVRGTFPKVIGYPNEFAPVDSIFALPAIERLNEWDDKGNPIPVLAESWEGDPVNKTITWHLRKGVKFHDGTDWNAEACRWNFQSGIDAKRLPDYKFVKVHR